jgi:hypothetical protein
MKGVNLSIQGWGAQWHNIIHHRLQGPDFLPIGLEHHLMQGLLGLFKTKLTQRDFLSDPAIFD